MTDFNFKLILKLLIALSFLTSIKNSVPISSQTNQENGSAFLNDSSSIESTKSPYAISFVPNTNIYDTSNSSFIHLNLSLVEQRMQKFVVTPIPLNSSLSSKTLFNDSNNATPKQMRQTFLYKYFNTTNSPKSSFKFATNTIFNSTDGKEENITTLISRDINATNVLPNLTFNTMNSYWHLAPQMFYFYMNASRMFYIDYIPDVNMLEMDRQEIEIVQDLVRNI